MKRVSLLLLGLVAFCFASAQEKFNGLDMNMGTLSRLSDAQPRSISPKTLTGKKGKAGWRIPKNTKGNVMLRTPLCKPENLVSDGKSIHTLRSIREKPLRLRKLMDRELFSISG